jgi:hypothetical protein
MSAPAKWLAAVVAAVPLTLPGSAAAVAGTPGTHPARQVSTWSAPVINDGGVVNGVDYSADDIHPGTTVAIFGEWFLPPDTVVVTQGSSQYPISAGSPWWYDSGGQINATLPTSLQPGQATVTVVTSAGQQSNAAPITINP